MSTADMFVGVESGYQGDKARISAPQEAANMLSDYARTSPNCLCFASIYPAVAVYGTTRGCPKGGEAVALVTLAGDKKDILATARSIFKHFNQSTLSICTHVALFGLQTRGFIISLEGDLSQIGSIWQEISNSWLQKTGQEISCGISQNAPGQVTVQADANPHKIASLSTWELAAAEMIQTLADRLGKPISPVFRDTGFTYLKKEL